MKQHLDNISKHYESKNRKQIINFKQLLKLKSMKKGRKFDHESSLKANILKEFVCNKSLQRGSYQHSQFKLPFQEKSFEEIKKRQPNQETYGKNCHEVVFPSVKTEHQHIYGENSYERINKSNKPLGRLEFFHKSRQINKEKLKQAISYRNKRKFRYFQSRQSQQSLPSKLDCQSIFPLTNYGRSSEKFFLTVEKTQYEGPKCRVSSCLQKVSFRYQDISISQFMYDRSESSQMIQKNIQTKMQRIWRKKQKNTKEITSNR